MLIQGPFIALHSAALFGISPTLTKLVMGEMSPVLLAGLLYLGSGMAPFDLALHRSLRLLSRKLSLVLLCSLRVS